MKPYRNYPTEKFENLKLLYRAGAEKFGEKTLFKQKSNGAYHEFSFQRYAADIDALGTALCENGFAGKHIIVMGENSYAWVTAYMAITCGVGVVVPLDKALSADDFIKLADFCEASGIIYSSSCADRVQALPKEVKRICFDELSTWVARGNQLLSEGCRSFLDAEIDADAMSILLFTSGTQGTPKGVMLSHRNICFNLSEMCQMIDITPDDTFLSVLPLHHVYECTCSFLCSLYRGSCVAFTENLLLLTRNMREVSPTIILCVPMLLETLYKKIWEYIRKHKLEKKVNSIIRFTNALPTEKLRAAAKRKLFAKLHELFGGKLQMMISGGAMAEPKILRGLRDFGIYVYQGYGLTECAPLAALNRDTYYLDNSAGMATPNTLLDAYDIQDDGIGEIRFKGANVMLGYYRQPQLTAEVIRGGWFYTGDFGYLDENGFLFITGRKQNVIFNAQGKHIFPEELEALLDKLPLVKEALVVSYKDPKKENCDLVALISPDTAQVMAKLGKNFTEAQLDLELKKSIAKLNATVQPYKRLSTHLIWKEEFPKNAAGKIKRMGIAEQAEAAYLAKIEQKQAE